MTVPAFRVAAFAALVCLAGPIVVEPATRKPLDYTAYDGWQTITDPKISEDGRTLLYERTPQDGEPSIVVRNIESGRERIVETASAPVFADDDSWVVFRQPGASDRRRSMQTPRNALGFLHVEKGDEETIDDVADFAVAAKGGRIVAYRLKPGGASASPSPAPSPASAAGNSERQPLMLVVRDFDGRTNVTVSGVVEYVLSDDGRIVAYTTRSPAGMTVAVHDTVDGSTRTIATASTAYRRLALSRDGTSVAFLAETEAAASAPAPGRLYIGSTAGAEPASLVCTSPTRDSTGFNPSAERAIQFSDDGTRVFYGTAPPRSRPGPRVKVDVWTTRDEVLQTEQRVEAQREARRTYLAVADVATRKGVQLASPSLRDVEPASNADIVLGFDDRPYRRAKSWISYSYADVYAVSLADGARRLLLRHTYPKATDPVIAVGGFLSPSGTYAVLWDEGARHWVSVATRTSRRTVLAANARAHFAQTDFDEPAPPPPYGLGGWLNDGRHVVLYDRFDLWLARLDDGSAVNLTRGEGSRRSIVYSTLPAGPASSIVGRDGSFLLSGIDWTTFDERFARIPAEGSIPRTVYRAAAVLDGPTRNLFHNRVHAPLAARNADRLVISLESYRSSPDLYATDSSFRAPRRLTDINPQQAQYRWGSEHLISFRAKDGTPLRGTLLVPDGVVRGSRAPMLVYYYEHYSDFFHAYWPPRPHSLPNFTHYVSNGYVVLLPDMHMIVGHPARSAYDSLMPAVDAALATGLVDRTRIGIAGYSWSGYLTDYILTKTHRFRAAFAGASRADLIASYGGIRLRSGVSRESTYEHSQARLAATPWDQPGRYFENSPIFGVRNVTTPYLTLHNELDGDVAFSFGVEWFTALRRLGKDAYMFSFDGEDHALKSRENEKYWTVALDEWFDYWLKGGKRPSWMNGVEFLQRGERDVRPLFGEPPEPPAGQ